jgi:hypothetical protein
VRKRPAIKRPVVDVKKPAAEPAGPTNFESVPPPSWATAGVAGAGAPTVAAGTTSADPIPDNPKLAGATYSASTLREARLAAIERLAQPEPAPPPLRPPPAKVRYDGPGAFDALIVLAIFLAGIALILVLRTFHHETPRPAIHHAVVRKPASAPAPLTQTEAAAKGWTVYLEPPVSIYAAEWLIAREAINPQLIPTIATSSRSRTRSLVKASKGDKHRCTLPRASLPTNATTIRCCGRTARYSPRLTITYSRRSAGQ